ncbi:MAG: hypothetical protein NTU53_09590 [Planctomycetota bacterium]|nr:hypothetical protein [Planctomycetota bacterium]
MADLAALAPKPELFPYFRHVPHKSNPQTTRGNETGEIATIV